MGYKNNVYIKESFVSVNIFVVVFYTFHPTCVVKFAKMWKILTVNSERLSFISCEVSQGDDASVVLSVVLVGQHGGFHVAHVKDVSRTWCYIYNIILELIHHCLRV